MSKTVIVNSYVKENLQETLFHRTCSDIYRTCSDNERCGTVYLESDDDTFSHGARLIRRRRQQEDVVSEQMDATRETPWAELARTKLGRTCQNEWTEF